MRRNKKGFTLVEILMVMAIMGILASVVLVKLNKSTTKAKNALIMTEADSMIKSIQTKAIKLNDYTGFSSLFASTSGWVTSADYTTTCNNFNGAPGGIGPSLVASCKDIFKKGALTMFIKDGYNPGAPGTPVKFSIAVKVTDGFDKYYCVGSNGRKSFELVGATCGGSFAWMCPGCMSDMSGGG